MASNQILEFVDEKALNRPKRLITTKRDESSKSKSLLEKFYTKLTLILNRLKPHSGDFAPKAVRILNSIVYKYGRAYKRHLFLRRARQSYSLAKKLSVDKVFPLIKLVASGLNDSLYEHNLTVDAIDHVSATILYRILMLDKLRIVCAKNVEFSIGYVEHKHNINLNLLFIALAAELGALALAQIKVLVKTYNEMSTFFMTLAKRPVPCLSQLPVKSFSIDDQNEFVERTIDSKRCDLDTFINFLTETDTSNEDDTLDEYDQAKLEEIYRILRTRTATSTDVGKKNKVIKEQPSNFYREIPKGQKKKKRKNK